MAVPIALAGLWAVSGIAAAVIIVRALVTALNSTDEFCAGIDDTPLLAAPVDVAPVDWRTLDDIRWAEIEQQWHQFLDSFEVRS